MKKKSKSRKHRNPYALLAKKRRGGCMKNAKDKRQNGDNKQDFFLNEEY